MNGLMVKGIVADRLLPHLTVHIWIWLGALEKVASDFGLGGGFHQVLWFLPPTPTGWS